MAVKKRRPSVRAAPYDKKSGATKTKGRNSGELVRLKGSSDFRYRVVCATLAVGNLFFSGRLKPNCVVLRLLHAIWAHE
eukprot:1393100-Amorphochlora_amoeboformis.AAC.3